MPGASVWWLRVLLIALAIAFILDLILRIPRVKNLPDSEPIKAFFILCVVYFVFLVAWNPIRREYLKEQKHPSEEIGKKPQAGIEPKTQSRDLAKSEVERIEPPKPSVVEPQLVLSGVNDPLNIVPQTGQPMEPKVTKFARIRVTNKGRKSIGNVRLMMIKINNREGRWQLPVASLDTLFKRPRPSAPVVSVNLNPGDDESFDVLVECNGTVCPKGEMAIPFIDSQKRFFLTSVEEGVSAKLKELTVRASEDSGAALTKTFRVSLGEKGELLLHEK